MRRERIRRRRATLRAGGGSLLLALLLWLAAPAAAAAEPAVAVIIDDLGNRLSEGMRAVRLPGPVTVAVLPASPHGRRLAEAAHASGKEVLLHQPMQSMEPGPMGPGGITLHMTERRVRDTMQANLDALPQAIGVSNHMGSLITRHPGHMAWIMTVLHERGRLLYVDSRTDHRTVAVQIAREQDVPVASRDVFLDNELEPSAIRRQLRRLVARARERGHAVGIGHPHPQTLDVLRRELPRLAEAGIALVPVSRIVDMQQEADQRWHVSSSPSRKAARSWKR